MSIKRSKGFTLIELLIVVAILAVLAAIAIPQFSVFRVKAYNAAAQSDLTVFRTEIEIYKVDQQQFPLIP